MKLSSMGNCRRRADVMGSLEKVACPARLAPWGDTCRNADRPYGPGSYVVTVDGFIVSANVTVEHASVCDTVALFVLRKHVREEHLQLLLRDGAVGGIGGEMEVEEHQLATTTPFTWILSWNEKIPLAQPGEGD